jgi:hypothetical protein
MGSFLRGLCGFLGSVLSSLIGCLSRIFSHIGRRNPGLFRRPGGRGVIGVT